MFRTLKPRPRHKVKRVEHLKARSVGRDRGRGRRVRRSTLSNSLGEYNKPSAPLALKWEAALAALPRRAGFQHATAPPSNTVVVSGVFLGAVIFKMMKEGSV